MCRPLKTFMVELALAWAARAHRLQLGGFGQWKLPKMRYKGDNIVPQKLRLQRNEPVSCATVTALAECDLSLLRKVTGWVSALHSTGTSAGGAHTPVHEFLSI